MTIVVSGMALRAPFVGQWVYASRLIAGLARQHCDFVVVAPTGVQKPPTVEERNFVNFPHLGRSNVDLIDYPLTCQSLLNFVSGNFPSSVFHSPGPIVGIRKPASTVVTLHDCLYRHFRNYDGRFKIRRFFSRCSERFAAAASLVFTDSEYSRKDLISSAGIPPAKIRILYPWVGNEFLLPVESGEIERIRSEHSLPGRFWLYLGGYDFRKNVELLLAAYAAAKKRAPLPPLVLAGAIPTRRHVSTCDVKGALQKNALTPREVLMPGVIPAKDLPGLYRAAALLVYPSLGEGFGLPPAEALASDTPVLVSNATSLPEVVRKSDCLFDPTDGVMLTEKLITAGGDETQFRAELSPMFTESYGIRAYLELLGLNNDA